MKTDEVGWVTASGPGGPSVLPVAPYTGIGALYDELLGDRMLPLFIRNLYALAMRHGMRLGRVADIGCGTGAFVMALRRRGVPAVGVDRSARMIALARVRSRRAAVRSSGGRRSARRIRCGSRASDEGFHVQDLRSLRLGRAVDLITCNFDVVNYLLSESALSRAFRSFAANLVPGGHVLFDVMVAAPEIPRSRRCVRAVRLRGIPTIWVVDLLPGGIRRVAVWIGVRGATGRRWFREVHVQRAHPPGRVLRALVRAGLSPVGVYDAYSLAPRRRGRPRALFVARRPLSTRPFRVGAGP